MIHTYSVIRALVLRQIAKAQISNNNNVQTIKITNNNKNNRVKNITISSKIQTVAEVHCKILHMATTHVHVKIQQYYQKYATTYET